MTYTTLVSPEILIEHLDDPDWAIFDCRFSLTDKESGRQAYRQAHIPGAVYAHLEEDLSAPIIPGQTGRHPLASAEQVIRVFSRLGISAEKQVVAYDDAGGALAAVRLWWMLRWLGVRNCAILNGGWQAWQQAGFPVRDGEEWLPPVMFEGKPRPELLVTAEEVDSIRSNPVWKVVDVRAAERFQGEIEPIDPVAGHIPGAINAPYLDNLTPEGNLRPAEELRAVYQQLLGEVPVSRTVFYCGSGVTSAHSVLALEHAGLGEGRLYLGSWSDWITDPARPVASG